MIRGGNGARGDSLAIENSIVRSARHLRRVFAILATFAAAVGCADTPRGAASANTTRPGSAAATSGAAVESAPPAPARAPAPVAPRAPGSALEPEPGWPRWLEARDRHADQTSGLAFVGRDASGARVFLVADDVGDLWRLRVFGSADSFALSPIAFEGAAAETLARFPKSDLEEISFCPITHRVILSIEGNGPKEDPADTTFREWLGVFELAMAPDALTATRVTSIARLDLPEWAAATRLATKNVGFEAASLCGDTLLLGLEGVSSGEGLFADSTLFEVYDIARGTRREISTHGLSIMTATGFARAADGRYFGIDRNSYRLFAFRIEHGTLSHLQSIPLSMPGVGGVAYLIPSAEAVAVDDEGFVWVVVDPWKYEPITREGLSPRDISNYKQKVPLIYKYRDPFTSG
ncbi:MAG: hypothetical protein ACKVU1_16685 [bacterium]